MKSWRSVKGTDKSLSNEKLEDNPIKRLRIVSGTVRNYNGSYRKVSFCSCINIFFFNYLLSPKGRTCIFHRKIVRQMENIMHCTEDEEKDSIMGG
jgi:hypothetical protein